MAWCTTRIETANTCRPPYTERLAEAGAVTSVGSRGDSYDNALAETIIGLEATYWRTQTPNSIDGLKQPSLQ